MKASAPFWLSLFERLLACVCIIVCLPTLIVTAAVVFYLAGSPIIVTEESRTTDGAIIQRFRFRRGIGRQIDRILLKFSIDELPALWNVARGEIKLRSVLRL